MPQYSEQMKRQRQQVKLGLALQYADAPLRAKKGTFIFDMKDAETGEQLAYFEKDTENQSKEHVRDA